ncbi:MAG TPA: hypothetical protein VMZ51_04300 [Acidimicrobiales bacterium]|nr:hypothetical protein [Acidimicrobiales bacterium]
MEPDEVRKVSHHLFGNAYLLESANAIGYFSDGMFTTTEVARAVQVDRNLVATALVRLENAGVIKRLARAGREQPYERVQTVFWSLCAVLLEELRGS